MFKMTKTFYINEYFKAELILFNREKESSFPFVFVNNVSVN